MTGTLEPSGMADGDWYEFGGDRVFMEGCAVGGCGNSAAGWLTVQATYGAFRGEISIPLCKADAAEWQAAPVPV